MSFTRPKLGPKVYLSRGTSGHTETFDRTSSDRELEMYLGGKAKLLLAIESFLRKMLLDRRIEGWSEVLEYLAERSGLEDSDLVPLNIAVAFWAKCDETRLNSKIEKLNASVAALGN